MELPVRDFGRRLLSALVTVPLVVASMSGCTAEAQRTDAGDVGQVAAGTQASPGTDSPLPLGRAPTCLGQPLPSPSPQYMRSYIDFVQLAGRLYALADVQPEGVVGGRPLGVVRCGYDDAQAPAERRLMDGDASRLPPGTPLLAHPDVDGRPALVADRAEGALLYVLMLQEGLGPRPTPSQRV